MKKILVTLFVFVVMLTAVRAELTTVNAFKHYQFGTGTYFTEFMTDKLVYDPGGRVIIHYTLENRLPHPLTEGKVRLQVFYNDPVLGEQMMEEFFAEEMIALMPGSITSKDTFYTLPSGTPNGTYTIKGYVQSDDYFNLAGLSFAAYGPPGVPAMQTAFTVQNDAASSLLMFDRSRVTLNGQPYNFIGIIPIARTGGEYTVRFPLVNKGTAKPVEVMGATYSWDDSSEKQYLADKSMRTEVQLPANGESFIEYKIPELTSGVYQVKIQASAGDEKVLLKLRFSISGEEARIYYQGFSDFPFKANTPVTLFATYSASSDYTSSFNGSVTTNVKSGTDTIFSEVTQQTFTSTPMGGEATFTPVKDINEARLTVTLKDGTGRILDERTTVYTLSELRKFEKSITLTAPESITKGDSLDYTINLKDTTGAKLKGKVIIYLIDATTIPVFLATQDVDGEYRGSIPSLNVGTYTLRVREPATGFMTERAVSVTAATTPSEAPKEKTPIFLYVAIIAGIALIVLLILMFMRKRGQSQTLPPQPTQGPPPEMQPPKEGSQ